MNEATLWYLVIGALLIFMALAGTRLKRLPVSTAALYVVIGYALGPAALGILRVDPIEYSHVLLTLSEVVLLVSLFSAGLKLRVPLRDRRWRAAWHLAGPTLLVTMLLLVVVGVVMLGLTLGAALVLAAILGPTDPALASDVQVENSGDRDRVRFALTGEAGMNDGIALPFMLLGLGLMHLHELGAFGWHWVAVDLGWSVAGGIVVGAALGTAVGHLVIYLRREYREALGLDEFVALGLMSLSYGAALFLHCGGFLAVFAAGVALRRVEHQASGNASPEEIVGSAPLTGPHEAASDPARAPAYMAQAVLGFNEQLERLAEVVAVLLVGGMVSVGYWSTEAIVLVPLLFLVIRPLSVLAVLRGSLASTVQRTMIAWFGIRGVGSIYYAMFALEAGLDTGLAQRLLSLVLTVIAISIFAHGISATPLMRRYRDRSH